MWGKRSKDSPVEKISSLRNEGLTNNQIVQELQKEGLTTQQIFDAMSQADLMKHEENSQSPPPPPPGMDEGFHEDYGNVPQQPPQMQADYGEYAPPPSTMEGRLHEVAEAIISEKWDEIIGEVQKVVTWKEEVETTLHKVHDEINALKENFKQLHQGVLGRINDSDEQLRNVTSELKAVHKVFKDVVPTFTENVSELSQLTKKLKKK